MGGAELRQRLVQWHGAGRTWKRHAGKIQAAESWQHTVQRVMAGAGCVVQDGPGDGVVVGEVAELTEVRVTRVEQRRGACAAAAAAATGSNEGFCRLAHQRACSHTCQDVRMRAWLRVRMCVQACVRNQARARCSIPINSIQICCTSKGQIQV